MRSRPRLSSIHSRGSRCSAKIPNRLFSPGRPSAPPTSTSKPPISLSPQIGSASPTQRASPADHSISPSAPGLPQIRLDFSACARNNRYRSTRMKRFLLARLRALPLALGLTALVAQAAPNNSDQDLSSARNSRERRIAREEWFIMQRTYPLQQIPRDARRHALDQIQAA